jgi:hypothetical protein
VRLWPGQNSVYTEFIEPLADDVLATGSTVPSLLSYDRGRRYLEARRRAVYNRVVEPQDEHRLRSFAKRTRGRRLAEETAEALGVTVEQMISDVQFADAVDTIVENCGSMGGEAFDVIFSADRPQEAECVKSLSRTADKRQRYRVEGMLDGRFRSLNPHRDDDVYDTVTFAEVPSRLQRARGSIRCLSESLVQHPEAEEVVECQRIAAIISEAATQLAYFVAAERVVESDVPQFLTKEAVWPTLRSKSLKGRLVGYARGALRLVIKNVWDYPEMIRRGLMPTGEEQAVVLREIEQIRSFAEACYDPSQLPRRDKAKKPTKKDASREGASQKSLVEEIDVLFELD